MIVTEKMLAPARRRFGDSHGTLPVHGLGDLYNKATLGITPIFDPERPDSYWKAYLKQHGITPTGVRLFSDTEEWNPAFDRDQPGDGFALVLAFTDRLPTLTERHPWLALRHFCAGHLQDSVSMVALELKVRAEVEEHLGAIAHRWRRGGLYDPARLVAGARERCMQHMLAYRAQLATLGVEWSGGKMFPRPACYTIDATQDALDRLAVDPPQLWAISRDPAAAPVILLLSQNWG